MTISKLGLFITVVLLSFSLLVAFNIGAYLEKEATHETLNKVAVRYFEHIGNPTTQDEHCTFIEVVYGDYTECN